MGLPAETPGRIRDSGMLLREILLQAASSRAGPLSLPQRRLWVLHQMQPETPRYNMASIVRLTGALDFPALTDALKTVAARHETLRTRFAMGDSEPMQVIEVDTKVAIERTELDAGTDAEREPALERAIQEEIGRPFDLTTVPLIRCRLFEVGPDEHLLVTTMHHLISDEWSFRIFHHELFQFYGSTTSPLPPALPELPIQYSDYADWQHGLVQRERFQSELEYWKGQLKGNPVGVELPTDYPRRSPRGCKGGASWRELDAELGSSLATLVRSEDVSLFMVLLAAFEALLFRYTAQEDLIVGTPVAGRNQVETENLIGCFVNTLALRNRLSGAMTFRELLAQVRETALGAYSNQEVPFERIVEALQPERVTDRTPFINVMFFLQHESGESLQVPGLKIEFLDPDVGPAKFDLTLFVRQTGSQLVAAAQFDAGLFTPETVGRFLEHYENLLRNVVAQPDQCIAELPFLGEAERKLILSEWSGAETDYPRNATVHELFEKQVQLRPETIALKFGGKSLSYGALNAQANRLARQLQKRGVTPRALVGLCSERSFGMIVGMLGILKCGAAYAPLDVNLPRQRVAQMITDLNPAALVTTHDRLLLPEGTVIPTICWERSNGHISVEESAADMPGQTRADGLAYVSFTSGSTGKPKGVLVPHRAIVRLVRNTNYAHFEPGDTFLQLAPLAFDASTFEIWACLLNGGTLVIAPPELPSLSELAELMARHRVTTAWFTSGLFNQIVDEQPELLKPLRQVLTGGDVLSPLHVRKALGVLGLSALINGYGPTENTTFSTCYRIPPEFDGKRAVPIGRPVSNTTCYVLDERLQPVPIGVPGELYVGGDGLAVGYLNDAALTARKFIPNPFQGSERLYKTGDLVRWLADGNLEFIGRNNDQVKIRGFRVELGEIEAALLDHPGVRDCAVVTRDDASGGREIIAYIVPRMQPWPGMEELYRFLAEHLPGYMIPTSMVILSELPLTTGGKVDRNALPAPERAMASAKEVAAPRDETEAALQAIWEEVLKVKPIGIHDRFFALGGHSLLAIRLLARVEKTFGRQLKVASLFQHPTIASLAAILRGKARFNNSSIVEIQPRGNQTPLFLVHGAGGGMFWGYSNLARELGDNQPLLAFKSRGLDGEEEVGTIEELARAYLADLRAVRPRGPYCLGGYCFGGVVAFEMSRQLQSQGERVEFLGLINSTAPNSRYTRFEWTPGSAFRFTTNLARRGYYSARMHPEKLSRYLFWKLQSLLKPRTNGASTNGSGREHEVNDDWVDLSQYNEIERRVWKKHLNALRQYRPQRYAGKVWLFRSAVHLFRCSFEADYGWRELAAGGLVIHVIPAAHEALMEQPTVRDLAHAMKPSLIRGRENEPGRRTNHVPNVNG